MKKTTTACCAMAQLSDINNTTTKKELSCALKILNKQMKNNTEVGITTGNGQTAIFAIVTLGEEILENNLRYFGFEVKHIFPRRVGYLPGNLKMMIKNL